MLTFNQYLIESQDNKIQTLVLNLISDVFKNDEDFKGIKNESQSRHPNQIRISYDTIDNIEDSLNKKIEKKYNFISIGLSPISGSDAYTTFEISINIEKLKNASNKEELLKLAKVQKGISFDDFSYMLTNFKCQLVYGIRSKTRKGDSRKSYLKNKEFAPANFGIEEGKLYSLVSLYNAILNKINSAGEKSKIALFERYLKEVMRVTCGIQAKTFVYPNTLNLKDISEADIDVINKDFGEIICALSVLKQNKGSLVEFPSINAKVVDFNLYINGDINKKVGYSVKNHGKSKGTAMSSISDIIDYYKKSTSIYPKNFSLFEKYINLMVVGVSGGKNITPVKIFDCAMEYSKNNSSSPVTSALDELKIIFNVSDVKFSTFKSAIDKLASSQDSNIHPIAEKLSKFYGNVSYGFGKSKYDEPQEIINLIHKKKYSIVVQPIGSLLTRELNKDSDLLDTLSTVLNCQNNLIQIETNMFVDKNGTLVYNAPQQRPFTSNKFKFDYNGMRNDDGSNRSIGFKMMK